MKSESKTNILLVDDRVENLIALEAVLSDLKQNLIRAHSGEEALRHLLNQDFSVILLDIAMPGIDGFETAALIRERERSRYTPIIFITAAFNTNPMRLKGYLTGAVDYLDKPLEPEVLRAKVGVFVELFQKREEIKRQAAELATAKKELEQQREIKRLNRELEAANRETNKLNAELEQRVWQRTAELQAAKTKLEDEIAERQRIEAELAEVRHRLEGSRERDRMHLARELHDGPVQDLYGVSFRLEALKDVLPNETSWAQFTAIQKTCQQVIGTLRTICGDLRPPTLAPFGLEKAIRSHADQFQEMYPELKVELKLAPDGQALPEGIRLALFRIYQEALNNLVRHAEASQVWIRFKLDSAKVVLEVQDDGHGFEVPERWVEMARQGHLGLAGAAERAEAIGGSLKIISSLGSGTTVQTIVPRVTERA
jgi:signal transduction histidine kinase